MLRQHYQEFQQRVQALQAFVLTSNPDGAMLQNQFQQIQQLFQQTIVASDWDESMPDNAANVQSFHTEINKQLRLLGMDVMFLRTARQSATYQKRQQQMSDRLGMVLTYCQALMGDTDSSERDPDSDPGS